MPCQTTLLSSHGPASKSEPRDGGSVNKPAASVQLQLIEKDPISSRVVGQGPHGLQLFIQLDNNAPPRTESAGIKRSRNDKKSQNSHQINNDFDIRVGEHLDGNSSGPKRSKTLKAKPTTSNRPTNASISEDEASIKDSDNDHIRSVTSYSDRINQYFEQIEDANSWSDSSQTILVVLGDVMRHVQTFGLPDPNNAEHNALHEEIRHEVAQIEHLVHDYTESLRRMKTSDSEDVS